MPTVECGASLCRAGVTCVCALCLFSRLVSCASQVGVRAVSHPALRGPETHTSAKFLTDLRWGSLCGSRALGLSPHSEGREAPVQNHSGRCQLQACGSGPLRKKRVLW